MNAMMTIDQAVKAGLALNIPEETTFEKWEELGRRLSAEHRLQEARTSHLNWLIGDWWAFGDHKYGERSKVAGQGIFAHLAFKTLMTYGSVSRSFETSIRMEHLSFAHHQVVSGLAPEERAPLMAKAEAESMPKEALRVEAMKRRVALGHFPDRVDDDPEHTELLDIARRWNRARSSVREEFLELANEANLGEIDP